MIRKITDREVIVPMTRLPENIGRMLNMYLSGEVTSLHIIGTTSDGRVISASTKGIPDLIRGHDSLVPW